jgi:uncharacterized coiled-coil protein SlyX
VTDPRGPYLSANRVLELERRIAELEGRMNARIEQLDRELAQQREWSVDLIRRQVQSLIDVMRGTNQTTRGGSP